MISDVSLHYFYQEFLSYVVTFFTYFEKYDYICMYIYQICTLHTCTHTFSHILVLVNFLSFSFLRVNLKLVFHNWSLKISGENILYFLFLGKGNSLFFSNFSIFGNKYKKYIQVFLVFHLDSVCVQCEIWGYIWELEWTEHIRHFFICSASKLLPVKLWNSKSHSYFGHHSLDHWFSSVFHNSLFILESENANNF